jgi:hypothetical protein
LTAPINGVEAAWANTAFPGDPLAAIPYSRRNPVSLKPEVSSLARYRLVTPWITNPRHWALRDKTLNEDLRRAGFPDE